MDGFLNVNLNGCIYLFSGLSVFLSVLIIMFLDTAILLFLSNNILTILVEQFGKEKSPGSAQIISAFVFCSSNVMKISCEGSRAVSVQR